MPDRVGDEVYFARNAAGAVFVVFSAPARALMVVRLVGRNHCAERLRSESTLEVLSSDDALSPAPGFVLRYVRRDEDARDVSLGVPVDAYKDLFLFAPSGPHQQVWRGVRRVEPGGVPCRLARFQPDADEVDESDFPRVRRIGGCATRVIARDPDDNVIVTDDVAGATFDDIVVATHEQGATLDPSLLFAILGPVAELLGSSDLRADADPFNIHVTFDGDVRFDGFLLPWLPSASWPSMSPNELAECLLLGGLLGPPVPHLDLTPFEHEPYDVQNDRRVRHRIDALAARAVDVPGLGALVVQIIDDDRTTVARRTLAEAVARWGATLPVVPQGALRDLVRGLFPVRFAAEERLREQLAMLDAQTIEALLGET